MALSGRSRVRRSLQYREPRGATLMSIDKQRFRRIATEEAWAPPDLVRRFRDAILDGSVDDPGFRSLMGYFLFGESPRTKAIVARLQHLGERRIADMDSSGIAQQVVALTAPGVQ